MLATGHRGRGRSDPLGRPWRCDHVHRTERKTRRTRPCTVAVAAQRPNRRDSRHRVLSTSRGRRGGTIVGAACAPGFRPPNRDPGGGRCGRPLRRTPHHARRRPTRTCRVCGTFPTSSARRKRNDSPRRSMAASGGRTSSATCNTTAGATTTPPGHVDSSMRLGSLPDWADRIGQRLVAKGLLSAPPDQVIVNEYKENQGISPHVDSPGFADGIATISLLESWEMVFRQRRGTRKHKVSRRLERCSAMILTDAARYDWTHEIPARKTESDPASGKRLKRKRRISLTFRPRDPSVARQPPPPLATPATLRGVGASRGEAVSFSGADSWPCNTPGQRLSPPRQSCMNLRRSAAPFAGADPTRSQRPGPAASRS